jgi:hypothetical protein
MKITYTFLFLIIALSCGAQEIEREVIVVGGNFYSNTAGQLSTTIGEPVISTYIGVNNVLTQGFQQTNITVIGIADYQSDFEMNLYPNPVSDFITIKIKELKENISFNIYTVEGKIILNQPLIKIETKLNIAALANGNYFVNISENTDILKTYKIVKQ